MPSCELNAGRHLIYMRGGIYLKEKLKLVIAEKPSVAMNLAKALGATNRKDGYLDGAGWLVSWCVGHLAGLAAPEVYNKNYAKWRREDLPIIPSGWRMTVAENTRGQFEILKKLLRRSDVSEVVNACDAGREGELIFRSVYHLAGCSKPIKRLWISSMEEAAIREGFANLRAGEDFARLYRAALCRAKADWLVGINATRLFSLLYGCTLHIGRVMSPTLAMAVAREAEITAFQPERFYSVEIQCGDLKLSSERMADKKAAADLAAVCQQDNITIKSVERQEKSEKPPLLYDLTALQREANRRLGYTAQQTLDYLQALYEKRLVTYPRTDSRYLTEDMAAVVPDLVQTASEICGLIAPAEIMAAQVCNNAKVSDHHAVVPTKTLTADKAGDLPKGENAVLGLVCLGLLRAVAAPCRYVQTKVTAGCGGDTFSAGYKEILDYGWQQYCPKDKASDKFTADLAEGEQLSVTSANVKQGKTEPKTHFTEDTILAAMEQAGGRDMPQDIQRKGIGTPATRAGILEKLVNVGLLERKKSKKAAKLLPTQLGRALITILPEELQSPWLTAEWEQRLLEVENGSLSEEEFMRGIEDLVSGLVRDCQAVPGAEVLFPPVKRRAKNG